MTFFLFCLIVFYASCSVAGQLFFKRAMSEQVKSPRARRFLDLAAGVLAMTLGFCTWLALLHRFDLSFLYPFEGLERVLLALAACLFLREKMTKDLWIGVSLICLGTIFVAAS
jgi:undecaprenyl phosphate-alpha-L-ara4N flippase subunit ArnE